MKQLYLSVFLVFIFGFSFSQSLFSSEEVIGHTWYDLQSNNACQNRLHVYDDGTIGAVWTMGMDWSNYPDRGTGYNYFDGLSWQPLPEERLETGRTGWPSYAPLGENGEVTVAHSSGYGTVEGLVFCKRTNKGTGDWEEEIFTGPPGHEGLLWPRMITSGENHENIHLLALSKPTGNGGSVYQGLNGALLYSHSTDQGETWDLLNQVLPGMDSSYYDGHLGDSYAFAEPRDSIIAFVAGSYAHDLFLMKSTDYGQTFTKTIIWDHPYDVLHPGFTTDFIYAVDGSIDVELDATGNAHVAFGIIKVWADPYQNVWLVDKSTDGAGYWNENRPTFTSDVNALNPHGDPDSELIADYSLLGWAQDMDGDGEITYLSNFFGYGTYGISSMVQLVIDDLNRIFFIYTSITETYDNGLDNYRRLWLRSSLDLGENWRKFYHYAADDPQSIFNEYAFPSCASNSDDYLYLTCMIDYEPGIYMQPSEMPSENKITLITIPKDEVVGIKDIKEPNSGFTVSQNTPNPFSGKTGFTVHLPYAGDVFVEVINLSGQQVFNLSYFNSPTGKNTFTLDLSNIEPGVYFYKVRFEDQNVVKKMIIQ